MVKSYDLKIFLPFDRRQIQFFYVISKLIHFLNRSQCRDLSTSQEELEMQKPRFTINQTVITAFAIAGSIALTAIVSNYSGNLQLKFGADGIQLQIVGGRNDRG